MSYPSSTNLLRSSLRATSVINVELGVLLDLDRLPGKQFTFFRFLCLFERHAVDRVRIRRREPEAYDFVIGQQIVIHGGLDTVDDNSIGLIVMLFGHRNSLFLNSSPRLLNTPRVIERAFDRNLPVRVTTPRP